MIRSSIYIILIALTGVSCLSPSVIATQSIQKGDEFNNKSNYSDAKVHYENFLEVSPTLGIYRNLPREAEVHRKLGYIHSLSNQYDSSLYHYHQALEIDENLENTTTEVLTDKNLIAITKAYRGDYVEALSDFESLMELEANRSVKTADQINQGDLRLSKARIHYVLGNYTEAQKGVDQSIEIFKPLEGTESQLSEAYYFQALLLNDKGQFDQGTEWLNKSIETSKSLDINYARQLHALGDVQFFQGNYQEGLQVHLVGLESAERSKIIPQIIQSLIRVGDAYSFIGDERTAGEYYQRAIRLQSSNSGSLQGAIQLRSGDLKQAQVYYEESGQISGAAEASQKLGDQFLLNEQFDSAAKQYDKALKLFEEINSNAGRAKTYLKLADLSIITGDKIKAQKYLQECAKLSDFLEDRWQILQVKGRYYHSDGVFDSAKYYYLSSISALEEIRSGFTIHELKTSFQGTKSEVYEDLIGLLIEEYEKTGDQGLVSESYAWNERARSRAFLDLLCSKQIKPKDDSHSDLLQEERNLRLSISRVSRELKESSTQNRSDLLNTLQYSISAYEKVTLRLQELDSAYGSLFNVNPVALADLQGTLRNDELMLQYWLGKTETYVWLVTNRSIELKKLTVTEKAIDRGFKYFRNSLGFHQDNLKASQLLYDQLIQPLEKELEGWKDLIIVPHRQLNFLPFQALSDSTGHRMIQSFNISYVPSGSILDYCRRQPQTDQYSLFGVALGNQQIAGFEPLPGTENEWKSLEEIFETTKGAIGEEATETYFLEYSTSHDLLHVATHGVLNSRNPLRSYLLFSEDNSNDGQLSVSEIFDMQIQAKLVTLSACETALGELNRGNDLVGLSRAFIYSGSNAVIVSLWKVDDQATSELMKEFYMNLKQGSPVNEAMTIAQRKLISKDETKSAKFWSPFIIIGNANVF